VNLAPFNSRFSIKLAKLANNVMYQSLFTIYQKGFAKHVLKQSQCGTKPFASANNATQALLFGTASKGNAKHAIKF
jgi:hypothetical protein